MASSNAPSSRGVYDTLHMGRSGMDLYSSSVGAAFVDIKVFSAYVGGSPTNTSVGCRRLGLNSALLTAFGNDPVGDFVAHFLEQEGVDISSRPRKPGRRTSAVVLDPNFCFPAALQQLPGRTGLLVTLEDNRWEETPGGRCSQAIRDWSVGKIKRCGVDLLKLESPQPGATLPALDGSADHVRAQQWFDEMGSICHAAGLPWVMLSAGVSFAQFERVMEYAYAAGANGFLAGRAIWSEALASFPDLTAVASGLRVQGQGQLHRLAELTLRAGTSWHAHKPAPATFTAEGEICAAYR